MLSEIKYFPVNWVDGMKISSTDFISGENALLDMIRDSRSLLLNAFNYGLLPSNHPEIDNYPYLSYDYLSNQLVLKECRAITPSGNRIEITEQSFDRNKYPAQLPAVPLSNSEPGVFDVYLHVDPSQRLGAGDFASNTPPRYLHVSPAYELALRAHDEHYIEQGNFLKISELEVRDGKVEIYSSNGRYIPPSITMSTHATLVELHRNYLERFHAIIKHQADLVTRMGVDTWNEVAQEAIMLMEKIALPVIGSMNYYRINLINLPPVTTICFLKDFASIVKFHLNKPFRGELINDYKPELISAIIDLERLEPVQGGLMISFERITPFLSELEHFFSELSKYNYNNQSFTLYDHNQLTASGTKPIPVPERSPVEVTTPPHQPTVADPERLF
jgi:hypothetical protein